MLNLNITEVHVADGKHNGVVRVLLDTYIGEPAQHDIDELVASNKDILGATLIAEKQVIVIEAATPTYEPNKLKKVASGLMAAVKEWYEALKPGSDELMRISYHHNVQREAHEAYSGVGIHDWREG